MTKGALWAARGAGPRLVHTARSSGRLSMTRHGYGFVEASEGDFFIPAKDIGGAMHGDIVAVRPETHRGRQGRAGAIAKVIERANTTLVGRFDRHGDHRHRLARRPPHPARRLRRSQRDRRGRERRRRRRPADRLSVADALGAGLRRGDRRPRGRSRHPDRDHHPRARPAHRVPRLGRRGGRGHPARRGGGARFRARPRSTSASGSRSRSTPPTPATSTTRSRSSTPTTAAYGSACTSPM